MYGSSGLFSFSAEIGFAWMVWGGLIMFSERIAILADNTVPAIWIQINVYLQINRSNTFVPLRLPASSHTNKYLLVQKLC